MFVLPIVVLLAAAPPAPSSGSGQGLADHLRRLQALSQQARGRADESLKDLEKLRSTVKDPKERAILDRFLQVARAHQAGKASGADLSVATVTALRELFELQPDSDSLLASWSSLALGPPFPVAAQQQQAWMEELRTRTEAFAKQHPDKPGGHLARSMVLSQLDQSEDALRAMHRCVETDRAKTFRCSESYRRLADAWTAPRCEPSAIAKDLAFYAEKQGGGRTLQSAEGPVEVAAEPIVRAADVASFSVAESDFGPRCQLTLRPEAAKRFEAATAELSKEQGRMPIAVGNDALVLPRVYEAIREGQLQLSGLACERICPAMARRPLPNGLPKPQ